MDQGWRRLEELERARGFNFRGRRQVRARSLLPPGEGIGTAGPAVSLPPPPSMVGTPGGILFWGLFQALGIQQ